MNKESLLREQSLRRQVHNLTRESIKNKNIISNQKMVFEQIKQFIKSENLPRGITLNEIIPPLKQMCDLGIKQADMKGVSINDRMEKV